MKKMLCAMALMLAAGCVWPGFLDPDASATAARVTVVDQQGGGVGGVRVTFEDRAPSGSTFTVSSATSQAGVALFGFQTSGPRKCGIELPAGFSAGPEGLSQTVDIVADRTTSVRFVIVR